MNTLYTNDDLYIDTLITTNLTPISGANPTVVVQRTVDDYYYNGSDWIVSSTSLNMTEVDDVNFP